MGIMRLAQYSPSKTTVGKTSKKFLTKLPELKRFFPGYKASEEVINRFINMVGTKVINRFECSEKEARREGLQVSEMIAQSYKIAYVNL